MGGAPAWDTERPASSMSWSMEKAPVLISSASSAAAAFAESVWAMSAESRIITMERRIRKAPRFTRNERASQSWAVAGREGALLDRINTP